MQSSVWNNPLFGEGLAKIVKGLISDPETSAQNQLMAANAKMATQTADFRDMHGAGAMSSGGALSRMFAQSMGGGSASRGGRRSSGGSRASGGGASTSTPADLSKLTQAAQSRLARLVKDAGYEGADAARVVGGVLNAYKTGQFANLDMAASEILPGVSRERTETVVNPNEFFGENGTWNPINMFRGPEVTVEETLNIPTIANMVAQATGTAASAPAAAPQANPQAAQALNQAREAVAAGASPEAVAARLTKMGIDPSQL